MIRLAATYGAVASTGAAAWVGWGQGQAQLAGAVILAALAFLAVRLWILGGVDLGDRLPRRDTVASVLLVGMIVTAGVAGPMAQPVAAADGETCTGLDAVIYDVLTWQNIAEDPDNPCSTQYQVNQAIQDMVDSDANQTNVDLYDGSNQIRTSNENWGTTHDNYINDTQSAAWMKAQVAVAETYESGGSKIQAKQAAIDAIEDYYAVKQRNLISKFNSSATDTAALRTVAENESGVNNNYVRPDDNGQSEEGGITGGYAIDTNTRNVTLLNGNTTQTVGVYIKFDISTSTYNWNMHPNGVMKEGNEWQEAGSVSSNGWDRPHAMHIRTAPVDDGTNYDEIEFMHFTDWWARWDKITTQNNNLEAEAETFVNATYDDFDAGTINASDVISANTAMFEYGTYDNTTDGNLYRSVGALSMMGFDTPSLNGSGTMTVTYQNQQYEGIVMAESAPNGTWTANTTYNTSNITGPVFLASTTGEKVDFAEGSEFRINEIRNEDGTSADSVGTTQYVYKTANTSEWVAMTEELSALRAEIESREPTGGGGTGGFDIGGLNTNLLVALAAVAAVLLLTRD